MKKDEVYLEPKVFISLGSNLGDREANLEQASQLLSQLPHTEITGKSQALLTRAVGRVEQSDYLNQVQRLATTLSPEELLEQLLAIEDRMGRVRTVRWGPRNIDLDILFYGTTVRNTHFLVLPHPELRRRPFFLEMIRQIDESFLEQWNWKGTLQKLKNKDGP